MKQDILTVIWKERQGLLYQRGGRMRAIWLLFVAIVMIAILLPLQMGEEWFTTAWSVIAALILPLLLVGTAVPESFAGERERHTLPTLLASRLPDRAILFGKLITTTGYGWGLTLILLALSLLVANLVAWQGYFAFYSPPLLISDVMLSLLMSGVVASLGVLISLRSATVQGAQQALMGALLIPLMMVQIVPIVLMSIVPNGRALISQITKADFAIVVGMIISMLLLLNFGLFAAALARFKRARLILD
jgi:ABC-2 type transport system permease protein